MADAGVCAVVLLVGVSLLCLGIRVLGGACGRYEQVDEHLAGTGLGHVEINDFGRDLARLVVHTSLVGAW